MLNERVSADELRRHWTLNFDDLTFLYNRPIRVRLDYAIQLGFYRYKGRFPKAADSLNSDIIEYICTQFATAEEINNSWKRSLGRTARRRHASILDYLNIKTSTTYDKEQLGARIYNELCADKLTIGEMIE